MALPALVLSVDQEDEICLKKGNSPQQLRRKAAWLSKPYFFNLLPQDVQEKLVDYGAERPLVHLCLFPQALDLKVATNEVLLAILQGDLPKAKAMVQQRPELLTRKGRARVCPGRAYKDITPLQAALCARNDKMSAMLKAYMQPQEIERQ